MYEPFVFYFFLYIYLSSFYFILGPISVQYKSYVEIALDTLIKENYMNQIIT